MLVKSARKVGFIGSCLNVENFTVSKVFDTTEANMQDLKRDETSNQLIDREVYLRRALAFPDTDLVKVITGIRRCGKSSLLLLLRQQLQQAARPDDKFISLNLEDRTLGIATADDLHDYCQARVGAGRNYFFLDEIQTLRDWHVVINSLRLNPRNDIYLTGSNAKLFSGDLATYMSGRYIETEVLPLSFSEYLSFRGFQPVEKSPEILVDSAGTPVATERIILEYLTYGGMPALAKHEPAVALHSQYFASLFDTIVTRDLMARDELLRQRGIGRGIQDQDLLRLICEFLADNIGNPVSANSIAGSLQAQIKTNERTVRRYLAALNEAYIFYPAKRYDLRGKSILRTLPKQYLVDLGFRSYLGGYRQTDTGRAFENLIYLQLRYLGWQVHVGALYGKEVDFVCNDSGRIIYIQVTDEMISPQTRERELAPLRAIKDAHEKWVITRQGNYPPDIDGIKIIPAPDFLLGASTKN